MNRRKKIIKKLEKKDKKANAKLHKSNKPVYVSKAERERLAELANSEEPSDGEKANEEKSNEENRTE